jgi:hypothetical protein
VSGLLNHTQGWTLDKHIPVAVVLTILVQTGGVIWWGARLDSHVSNHEVRIVQLEKAAQERLGTYERIVRLEAQQEATARQLLRLEEVLGRLEDKIDRLRGRA